MKKITKILTTILVLCTLILLFGGNKVQAADTVTVTKEVYSNNGSMKFTFAGLELDTDTKTYEFAFTKQKAEEVTKWYDLTEVTDTTATVNITTITTEFRQVINASDTGYVTIREKGEEGAVVLPAYAVDLKIPYLKITNYVKIDNGKEFGNTEDTGIQVTLRNAENSQASFQYEKVTDTSVINKYKEIKAQNGNFNDLENMIKTTPPTSNWTDWQYWNGYFTNKAGYGFPERQISAPGEGLYYLWLYFPGDSIKDLYGCILVDNLQPEIALESISLHETASVELGKTITLTPTFNPSGATNKIVTWKSSDETVATIDNNGKVTPIKVGSTVITVTSQDGNKTATCTVTVTAPSGTATGSGSTGTGSGSAGTGSGSGSQNGTTQTPPKDDTTLQGKLPQTGMTYLGIVVALAMVGLGVVSFKKYKNYKV